MDVLHIINTCRTILADPNEDRWTDSYLLGLFNQAIVDMYTTLDIGMKEVWVKLDDGIGFINLSDFFIRIDRVSFNSEVIPMISYRDMDKLNPGWEDEVTDTDEFESVVIDTNDLGIFRLYPARAGFDQQMINPFNSIPEISELGSEFGDPKLKILGLSRPKIFRLQDEWPYSNELIEASIHYVVGRALRDNRDVQDRQVGNEELQIYSSLIAKYKAAYSKNSSGIIRTINYRTFK